MNKFSLVLLALLTTLIITTSCKTLKKPGGGFNLFTVQQDIDLGKQVKAEIESNKKDYPILPEASNRQAYAYIRKITNKLLNTGKVAYRMNLLGK